jgi:DNA-binding NtrC family response regulator
MTEIKKHILVAEDERNLAVSLYFILTAAQYQVSLAHNGREALAVIENDLLSQNPIDLLITDILMPEINGEQLLGLLRKKHIDIPSLIMTGYADKMMIVRLMRLGCNDPQACGINLS